VSRQILPFLDTQILLPSDEGSKSVSRINFNFHFAYNISTFSPRYCTSDQNIVQALFEDMICRVLMEILFVVDDIKENQELNALAENFRDQAAKLVEMLDVSIPVVAKLKVYIVSLKTKNKYLGTIVTLMISRPRSTQHLEKL